MQDLDPTTPSETGGSRWHLLWVVAALAFAWVNLSDFSETLAPHLLILAVSWICLAFSWYTRPFRVRWNAKAFGAIEMLPCHARITERLWNLVTITALTLLLIGLALKFAIST